MSGVSRPGRRIVKEESREPRSSYAAANIMHATHPTDRGHAHPTNSHPPRGTIITVGPHAYTSNSSSASCPSMDSPGRTTSHSRRGSISTVRPEAYTSNPSFASCPATDAHPTISRTPRATIITVHPDPRKCYPSSASCPSYCPADNASTISGLPPSLPRRSPVKMLSIDTSLVHLPHPNSSHSEISHADAFPRLDAHLAETPSPDMPARPTTLPMSISIEPDPDHFLVTAIHRIVSLSLRLLEHDQSVQTLVNIGAASVRSWRQPIIYPTQPCENDKYPNKRPSDDEMRQWVKRFLGKLRHCFPHINVRNLNDDRPLEAKICGGKFSGYFSPDDWVEKAKQRCKSNGKVPINANVMLHWEPRDAGMITLDLEVSLCLARPSTPGLSSH